MICENGDLIVCTDCGKVAEEQQLVSDHGEETDKSAKGYRVVSGSGSKRQKVGYPSSRDSETETLSVRRRRTQRVISVFSYISLVSQVVRWRGYLTVTHSIVSPEPEGTRRKTRRVVPTGCEQAFRHHQELRKPMQRHDDLGPQCAPHPDSACDAHVRDQWGPRRENTLSTTVEGVQAIRTGQMRPRGHMLPSTSSAGPTPPGTI